MGRRKPLIIYHAHCADGFGAAFSAWKRYGAGADYAPASHGEAPPDVRDRDVVIADFAWPRATLLEMQAAAASILVLDHHKSAQQDLEGLDFARFDLGQSGAMLAWRHFHPDVAPPALIEYVQDKDLWHWKLDRSAEVSAALASHPFDFELWDRLSVEDLKREGAAIVRYQDQLVREICLRARRETIAGHSVPVVNTPVLQSYVGNRLAHGESFVALWYQKEDGRIRWSLRSAPPIGIDVSALARARGGGGHPAAAGFETADRRVD